MMNADRLRELCVGIRARAAAGGPRPHSPEVDDELVSRIEEDVTEYRLRFHTAPVPQFPPEPLDESLPLMGWLIYEASLDRLWEVRTQYAGLAGEPGEKSRAAAALVQRLADAARRLPWPEFAPRALGAIRALALVKSKLDTEIGYDAAWVLHNEADDKYQSYKGSHGNSADRDRFVLALDEVLLQLALAETGTACRTAERVIGRWAEEFAQLDADLDQQESRRWTQRMFTQLSEGVEIGERALDTARRISETYGFAQHVSDARLTLPTGLRNPAIMTCRAILLVYSLCPEMERLGRTPPAASWSVFQQHLRKRFDRAFAALVAPVSHPDGRVWKLSPDHQRSLVQICLHLALVTPRHPLPEEVPLDDLTLRVLDDDAVEIMSAWLAVRDEEGQPRGDANIIGSASKPDFIASVEDCREDPGAAADYWRWRIRWFRLDRYAYEPGRRERIAALFGVDPGAIPPP